MNKRVIPLLLFITLILSGGCFHYINYSFLKTSAPDRSPESVGDIIILPPLLSGSMDDPGAQELIIQDVIGSAADVLDETGFTSSNGELKYKVEKTNPRSFDTPWEDVNISDTAATGKYLFTFVEFKTNRISGYVYKRVYDPTYNSYYYREVYEEKTVFNVRIQIILRDFDSDTTIFDKSFSNSEEFSQEIPNPEEYVLKLYGDYLRSSFDDFRPKEYKVKRYLIGR